MTANHPFRPSGQSRLSVALQRHYFSAGHQAAMSMPEDAAMVRYMQAQLEALVAALDDPADAPEVTSYWGHGFETAVVQRVHAWQATQDALKHLQSGRHIVEIDCRQSNRITGTLHAPKKDGGEQ